jgi:hypothetical protein
MTVTSDGGVMVWEVNVKDIESIPVLIALFSFLMRQLFGFKVFVGQHSNLRSRNSLNVLYHVTLKVRMHSHFANGSSPAIYLNLCFFGLRIYERAHIC